MLASSAGQWFGRANTKVLDSGVTVLAYREGSDHQVNDGELHIKFSGDYGETWTAEDNYMSSGSVTGFPMNPPLSSGEDAGEPKLYIAPNGNLLIHMWRVDYNVTASGTYQAISTDGGATWSTPNAVYFSGITNTGTEFATEDDFFISGTLYAGVRKMDNVSTSSPCAIYLIKSIDNGVSWEVVSTICSNTEGATTDGSIEVGLEYLGDNRIIATLRMQGFKNAYQRFSDDMGDTWGDLEILSTSSSAGILGRTRVYTRAHLKGEANWWEDDVLFMVGFLHASYGSSIYRYNCIWISLDKGITWSRPFFLDALYEDAGYADMFYDPILDQYVIVSYRGTQAEAVLVQYKISINGLFI